MTRITGKYARTSVGGEAVAAFVPHSLPPARPPLSLDASTAELLRDAEYRISRLDLAGDLVPSVEWFLYAFVRKEAVLSSQIEGTQASLVDLLRVEAGAVPESGTEDDVQDVSNHLAALAYARAQVNRKSGLPLSVRLLNETHKRLMKGVRGADKRPGEVRRSQNWVGGTRPGNAVFVPPPSHEVPRLLGELEQYIHGADELPPLVRAGLVHVQFETIHPYLDGNGRIGRLLISLLLEHWSLLSKPLLYLSLYFKRRRAEYYDRLARVRVDGDWEGWTSFFLDGVATTADQAVNDARSLYSLVERDRVRLLGSAGVSVSTLRLFEALPRHPVVTLARVVTLLKTTKPTAASAISGLEHAGVLSETTGRQRDRVFVYTAYLERLRSGTDLAG